MTAVRVKPIQQTVISDKKIIAAIIREATTTPSTVALVKNKEASDLLRILQKR